MVPTLTPPGVPALSPLRFVPLLLLILAPAWAAPSPADTIGRLDAFDGPLTVVRDGVVVPTSRVDTGFVFENADQIRVGRTGWADLSLDTKTGIRAHLHLKESTAIALDLSSLAPKAQVGALDLLVGSLALKVDKLLGGNRLDVHTETAVMGVRGTTFAVETEVDGSVMVLTDEGRVEVAPGGQPPRTSVPGTVVLGEEDDPPVWTDAPVTDGPGFTVSWHKTRFKRFQDQAGSILARMADRFTDLQARYARAEARVEKLGGLWDRWAQEERLGRRGLGLLEKKLDAEAASALAEVRRLALTLERLHRRFGAIEAVLGPDAFASWKVAPRSASWAAFVKDWRDQAPSLERSIAASRFKVKLFALRHQGRLERPQDDDLPVLGPPSGSRDGAGH